MKRRIDVRDTYDRIAHHFARTRPNPWAEVETFLEGRSGDLGLDIGIGNGRHAGLLARVCRRTIGLDISSAVLETACERSSREDFRFEAVLGEATALPIRSNCIDLAVYVATIHHLPTRETRIASLDELDRVLADGGVGIVSAWCTTHDRFDRENGFDATIDWTLPDGKTVPRFYHIYDEAEFQNDLEASRLHVESVFVSAGNVYASVAAG